jgi:broad-specificity NMP kinase
MVQDGPMADGLFVVSGAPGAGKSTVVPPLIRQNPGSLVIADMDELLDDGSILGIAITDPDAAPHWPAYNALWRRIVQLVRRSGPSVLLLCPLAPDELPGADAWLHLDCQDDVRRKRLAARGWTDGQIDEALADAADLRRDIPRSVLNDGSPAEGARQILAWVNSRASHRTR